MEYSAPALLIVLLLLVWNEKGDPGNACVSIWVLPLTGVMLFGVEVMLNADKALFSAWKGDYNWQRDDCRPELQQYGEYLSAYLRNQYGQLVLNINGEAGSGKTEFLKQLYCNLLHDHHCPVVYIDVWESDLGEQPLPALVAELVKQLGLLIDNAGSSVSEQQLATLLEGVTSSATDGYNATASENGPITRYRQQQAKVTELKQVLRHYIRSVDSDGRGKAYLLIDKLDRCRPGYVVALLEVFRHYLCLDELVVVMAADAVQLSHSIQAAYGYHFDSQTYLQRFFSRTANLPQADLNQQIRQMLTEKHLLAKLSRLQVLPPLSDNPDGLEECAAILVAISRAYNLNQAGLNQVVDRLDSLAILHNERLQQGAEMPLFNVISLLVLLIELGDERYCGVYKERGKTICRMFYGRDYQIPEFRSETAFNSKITHYLPEPDRSECKAHLDVAWEFINGFTHSVQFKQEQYTLQMMISNVSLEGRNPIESEVVSFYRQALQDIAGQGGNFYLWQREDYFAAAELANHLV